MTANLANKMYEEAYVKEDRPPFKKFVHCAWSVFGLSLLIGFVLKEPISRHILQYLSEIGASKAALTTVTVVWMFARGFLAPFIIGYCYHRFFQHVGFLTRNSSIIRRFQRIHWNHHVIIYCLGPDYKRVGPYIASEPNAWSWVLAIVVSIGLFALLNLNAGVIGILSFIAGVSVSAKLFIDRTHQLFHILHEGGTFRVTKCYQWLIIDPWLLNTKYFARLEHWHLKHHWNQMTYFGILEAVMDWLFGTTAEVSDEALRAAREGGLTVSDLINFGYLFKACGDGHDADDHKLWSTFISAAKTHKPSVEKVRQVVEVYRLRLTIKPDDQEAERLLALGNALYRQITPGCGC